MPYFAAGRYSARVADQYFTEAQRQATVRFCLRIDILQNLSNPDAHDRQVQPEITWWVNDRSLTSVMRDLRTLGYRGQSLSGVDPDTDGFHDFRGQEIEVYCTHEEGHDGQLWEQWKLCSGWNLKNKQQLDRLDRILTDRRSVGATGTEPDFLR